MGDIERISSPHVWFWQLMTIYMSNACIELLLKGLYIGNAWRPCVGFKVVRRWSSEDQGVIQDVIRRMVLGDLSLWLACLEEEEDWVSIHVYLQDIIVTKNEEMIQGLLHGLAPKGRFLIAHEKTKSRYGHHQGRMDVWRCAQEEALP